MFLLVCIVWRQHLQGYLSRTFHSSARACEPARVHRTLSQI